MPSRTCGSTGRSVSIARAMRRACLAMRGRGTRGAATPSSQYQDAQCFAASTISSPAPPSSGGAHERRVRPQPGPGPGQCPPRHRVRPPEGRRRRIGRAAGLGRDQPAAPSPRHVQVQRAGRGQYGRASPTCWLASTARSRRRPRRRPARARGHRICLRHPAGAEGRIYAWRRPRHRRLFDAPAARHRRRHHPVQLPGDDPDVDVRHGDRLRQRLHPQAVASATRASRSASPS